MLPLEPLTALIALSVLLIGVFLALGVSRLISKPSSEEAFQDKLAEIHKSELEEDDTDEKQGWMEYWRNAYARTGRISADPDAPGKGVIVAMFAMALFGLFIFPGGVFGIPLGVVAAPVAAHFFFNFEANRRSRTLEKQLPLLLSSLRANIQARATPQSALMSVADEIPAPLGDELKLLRAELNVNVPIDQALANFSDRVDSRELKFLASSIDTAVSSGQDLDPQLETIQRIVEQRTRIRNKLSAALSEVSTALWVSGVIIPAALVYSFYSSDTNREFWFSFFGLIALLVVAGLYATGLFISYRLVKGVEKT